MGMGTLILQCKVVHPFIMLVKALCGGGIQVEESSFALREAKGKLSNYCTSRKGKRGQPENHIFILGRLWPGRSLMYHCCLADCGRAQKSNQGDVSKALKRQYKAFRTMLLQETEPGAFWIMNPCCRQ